MAPPVAEVTSERTGPEPGLVAAKCGGLRDQKILPLHLESVENALVVVDGFAP